MRGKPVAVTTPKKKQRMQQLPLIPGEGSIAIKRRKLKPVLPKAEHIEVCARMRECLATMHSLFARGREHLTDIEERVKKAKSKKKAADASDYYLSRARDDIDRAARSIDASAECFGFFEHSDRITDLEIRAWHNHKAR